MIEFYDKQTKQNVYSKKTIKYGNFPYIKNIFFTDRFIAFYKEKEKPYYSIESIVGFAVVKRYADIKLINGNCSEFKSVEPLVIEEKELVLATEYNNFYEMVDKRNKKQIKRIKKELKKLSKSS